MLSLAPSVYSYDILTRWPFLIKLGTKGEMSQHHNSYMSVFIKINMAIEISVFRRNKDYSKR